MKANSLSSAILLALACTACSVTPEHEPQPSVIVEIDGEAVGSAGLKPEQARITDEAIYADVSVLDRIQERIKRLNSEGLRSAFDYHFTKAQHWLDFARDEYSENDRYRVIEGAVNQTLILVGEMEEEKSDISMDTPLVPGSIRVREDLWQKAAEMKQHPGFRCAQHLIAEFEVRLVQAGHEEWEMGWRHSLSDIRAVERLVKEAEIELARCAIEAEEPVTNRFTIAYFDFDLDDPKSETAQEIQRLMDIIASMDAVISIDIFGHTDRLGSDAYNMNLSQRRVDAIRQMLIERGLDGDMIKAKAFGESQPVVECQDSEMADRKELKACLAPNRRVEIEVVTSKRVLKGERGPRHGR